MTFYKTKYSSGSNDVALLYKRQLSCVLIFYSKLELLDNSQEINILWGNFNFDILDSEIFERITSTLSNFYYPVAVNCAHLNRSLKELSR